LRAASTTAAPPGSRAAGGGEPDSRARAGDDDDLLVERSVWVGHEKAPSVNFAMASSGNRHSREPSSKDGIGVNKYKQLR